MVKFYLLIGPSGVGKSKLQEKLVSDLEHIVRSISATTRPPREEEHDGTDYFFYNQKVFFDMVGSDEFLEFKEYAGEHYGTPKKFIEDTLNGGSDVVGVIEVKGAQTIIKQFEKEKRRECVVSIFVYPEHFQDLVTHLKQRDTKSGYSRKRLKDMKRRIMKRMTIAVEEIEHLNDFDYRICMRHNKFDETYNQLRSIVIIERARDTVDESYASRFVKDYTAFCKSYRSRKA